MSHTYIIKALVFMGSIPRRPIMAFRTKQSSAALERPDGSREDIFSLNRTQQKRSFHRAGLINPQRSRCGGKLDYFI